MKLILLFLSLLGVSYGADGSIQPADNLNDEYTAQARIADYLRSEYRSLRATERVITAPWGRQRHNFKLILKKCDANI